MTRSLSLKSQEHPAAFLAPFEDPSIGEDLEVARDTRLALPKDLGELADRQFHNPEQRQDAQPRWVGKRLNSIGERKGGVHGLTI